MERLETSAGDRSARNGRSLAPTGFRYYWNWKSRRGRSGRPRLDPEIRTLLRRMSRANPLWGAPRIHGELLKLGIEISQTTVAKYLPRRRRVVHFNVTEHPTAEWTAQQILEAFPWDTAPRYLLRDRDGLYGRHFRRRVAELNVTEVLTAPRAPWQNPYAERLIGSIRRDCLDHVIVIGEAHLRRVLGAYLGYYQNSRAHLSLEKDTPEPREVQPPTMGEVVELPEVGGLHHRYERRAA